MNETLMIAGMAAVTFAVRYPVLALVGKIELPRRVFEALRYVAPSVLAAIIVPAVLLPDNQSIHDAASGVPLAATLVAALVMWRSKNLLITIVVGMAAFAVLRLLIH